jgi:2-keto-3-deoxy-L-rhamnonate aldolase RhmA
VRPNTTLAKLRRGRAALGLWLHSHSFHTARIIAANGVVDWLLVDFEHTPVDLSTASTIFAAVADVSAGACTPLARVAQGSMTHIKHALDAGAQGVIVPMVNTAQDATDAVRYSRYPPLGERGAGGLAPHYGFGTNSHIEYVGAANQEILVSVQIETRAAVENIDSILAVPGIDMVFIGPFDLHISLGLPPALWSDAPAFLAAIQAVTTACTRHGLPYGTLAPNTDGAIARLADGFTFVSIGTDLVHLLSSLTAQTNQVRAALPPEQSS